MDFKQYIENAINDAENNNTKLSNRAFEIDGMSSRKNRIFLNSLLSNKNLKYLEIGCWKGSTLYSALDGNSIDYAVAIDNWCEFQGPKNEFHENMKPLNTLFEFYDEDCFSIDTKKFKEKFNIYFYDGRHEEEDQEKALTYYIDSLEDTFVYICDDWNWERVQQGTRTAIKKLNLKIENEWELPADFPGDRNKWWNGFYIGIIKK